MTPASRHQGLVRLFDFRPFTIYTTSCFTLFLFQLNALWLVSFHSFLFLLTGMSFVIYSHFLGKQLRRNLLMFIVP